jgi:hypothetical protein
MDEYLNALIAAVRQAPEGSLERRKVLSRLIIEIQNLPGIVKSSHPKYPEALNDTWRWVCRNIQKFDINHSSISGVTLQSALVNWINSYLRYRIKDLRISKGLDELNLDVIRLNDATDNISQRISGADLAIPTLSGLEAAIEKEQQQQQERLGLEIRQYIEQDPEGKLQSCYLRGQPKCNCQYLSQRLLLKEPPDRQTTIARDLNVPNQSIATHWRRKCRPMLQEIALNLGHQRSSEL